MEDEGDNKDTTGSSTGTVLLDPTTTTTTTIHEHLDTFQKTQAQLEAIEKEIKENQPLTSHSMDIVSLRSEYDKDHSATTKSSSFFFELGINELAEKYSTLRKTRGDGNCYYRSFLYSLSEALLSTPENDNNNERGRILQYGTWILQTQQLLVRMPPPSFMSHLYPLPKAPLALSLSNVVFWFLFFSLPSCVSPTQSTNSQGFHGLCDVSGRVRRDGC
jgi:Peptidase C65 Otubain